MHVEQSYPGELAEPSAGKKLTTAMVAVAEQLGVELEPLRKGQEHRGGELDVIGQLGARWADLYKGHVDRMNAAIVETYGAVAGANSFDSQ